MNTAQRKIKSYVGFAIKSGNIIYGADTVTKCKKRNFLILLTNTINRTADKRVRAFAANTLVKLATISDNEMEEYVNKTNCKCIAITDKNLAHAIINCLYEGGVANE